MIVNSISHEQRQRAKAARSKAKSVGETISLERVSAAAQAALVKSSSNYFMHPTKAAARALGIEQHIAGKTSDYLHRNKGGNERVVLVAHRNFETDTLITQQAEMIAEMTVVPDNDHAFEHLVVSPGHGIKPTEQQMREVPGRLLDLLGVGSHKAFVVWHGDTVYPHGHIGVSRVDPATGRRVAMGDGWLLETLGQAIAQIEYEQGWQPEPNARYHANEYGVFAMATRIKVRDAEFNHLATARDYKRIRAAEAEREAKLKLSPGAIDYERHHGRWSDERTAKHIAWPIIRDAATWPELHRQLGRHGIRYEQERGGARLFLGDRSVTATTANGAASLEKLKPRLKGFQPRAPDVLVYAHAPPTLDGAEQRAEKAAARKGGNADRDLTKTAADNAKAILLEEHKRLQATINETEWVGRAQDLELVRGLVGASYRNASWAVEECRQDALQKIRRRRDRDYEGRDGDELDDETAENAPGIAILIGSNGRHDALAWTIAGYEIEKTPTECRYLKAKQVKFIDHGNFIAIQDATDRQAVTDALKLAAAKWERVHIVGDRKFIEAALDIAIDQGIVVTNPELQSRIAEKHAAIAHRDRVAVARVQQAVQNWPFLHKADVAVVMTEAELERHGVDRAQMMLSAGQAILRGHYAKQNEELRRLKERVVTNPHAFLDDQRRVRFGPNAGSDDYLRARSWMRDPMFARSLEKWVRDAMNDRVSERPGNVAGADVARPAAPSNQPALSPRDIALRNAVWRASARYGQRVAAQWDALERLDRDRMPCAGEPLLRPNQDPVGQSTSTIAANELMAGSAAEL